MNITCHIMINIPYIQISAFKLNHKNEIRPYFRMRELIRIFLGNLKG